MRAPCYYSTSNQKEGTVETGIETLKGMLASQEALAERVGSDADLDALIGRTKALIATLEGLGR
jgi:hypothetical protein